MHLTARCGIGCVDARTCRMEHDGLRWPALAVIERHTRTGHSLQSCLSLLVSSRCSTLFGWIKRRASGSRPRTAARPLAVPVAPVPCLEMLDVTALSPGPNVN
eukprot:3463022-Prymnesium_polylepis.1